MLGWAACVIGLLCTLWGVFHISIAYEVFGILLGGAGYALGARRFGVVTVVISALALVFVLAAAQGYIPGIEPTDPRSRNL
jgi:hypothetical protein